MRLMRILVWYDIEDDILFTNWVLDACFFSLSITGIAEPDWRRYELIGEL